MIDLWSGAMVVGGSDAVAVVSPSHPSNGFCVKVAQDGGQVCIRRLLEMTQLTPSQDPFRAVAWALSNEAPFDPLIVCSRGRILYVLDAKQKNVVGKLRGHGGVRRSVGLRNSFHPLTNRARKSLRSWSILLSHI